MSVPVRVVVATDERYAMPTAACVRSVIDSRRPTDNLEVIVLGSGLLPETVSRLMRSWAAPRCTVALASVDLDRFAGMPTVSAVGAQVTTGVYARLLLADLLPSGWDRVIYLDCDTIVRHPLAELWMTDLDGAVLGAVRDDYIPTISSPHGLPTWRRLGLDPGLPYFNSGVLLIDLTAWRRHRVGERAQRYLAEHAEDIRLFDQDALNAVIAGRWRQLDTIWNVTSYWRKPHRRSGAYTSILDEARIRHFAGYGKPWDPQPLPGVPDGDLFFASLARTAWQHPTTERTDR